jgi:hypothetical protein
MILSNRAGLLAAACAALAMGCSGNPQRSGGDIGLELQVPGGLTLNTVQFDIAGPASFSRSGVVDVSHSSVISFTVGGIPAGAGYIIALTATATDGTTTCAGSATFNVVAGATTQVVVNVDCHQAPVTGTIGVTGNVNICPVIDGITAIPNDVPVGATISLSSAAHDTDNGPSPIAFLWTATSGTLNNATTQTPTFTCGAAGIATITLTVSDGDSTPGCPATLSTQVTCDGAPDAGGAADAGATTQALLTTIDDGVSATTSLINQGTAIGQGSGNGATPFTLTNLAADPNNTQTIVADGGVFLATGNVPDTAAGFCNYPLDGGTPTRVSYVTGAKFETTATADPLVPMAPFYFPFVYTSALTPKGNAFGGQPPILGLFDWRPKDTDEALVAAESDDNGKTWYFMQTLFELHPDLTNPISGGFSATATDTGCPATIGSTNANTVSVNGSIGDDGWGHSTVLQLPGAANATTGQFLYMLDRNANGIVDVAGLRAINLTLASNKFPIWNTNTTTPGSNDIKSIGSALNATVGNPTPVIVQSTVGLLDPDGILAVFPTSATAAAGSPVTVLYVQKILNGDNTGPTALPLAEQCARTPSGGKANHDISNVRLATTIDGINFTDQGIVSGLNDPATVDYTKTRYVSPRGTLLDINGDGSLWGLYFGAGNCLDGDSDAFHYIGYAESADKIHWTVFNDINSPIASINRISATNQATGRTVTVPANAPVIATQPWFAQRLYAPSATRVDATHLSLTFAGYGVQSPNTDLLDYRQIGNVVLTVSKPLPAGVPNNSNAH